MQSIGAFVATDRIRASLCVGLVVATAIVIRSPLIRAQDETRAGEWRSSGGDSTYKRYSPLAQITRDNVKNLRVVWRRPALDPALKEQFPKLRTNNYLRATPTMIGGVLYAPDATGLVQAFDATTGQLIWRQAPVPDMADEATASSTRGVDFWKGGSDYRLFNVRNGYLYALDLRGRAISAFGTGGRVNLLPAGAHRFGWTSGPIVVGDVIVIAGNLDGAGDEGQKWKNSPPEDVRGFDARSGTLLWTFHVVPRGGEFGADTWGNGSGALSGDLGSWCCISADEQLGYVYIPLTAPTAAYFGGFRPGDNLFSNALVALDAKTGRRVWHFQMVHHDLWEYDTVGPATLGEITVDGRRIKAVMQPSKTGFLYVFDRVTGQPVWPIEERPVPQSTIPGEHTARTQPFPTKPAPFARVGLTDDDLIDFTPALRARARELAKTFVLGPIFTPPSLVSDEPGGKQGTLMVPRSWGAGNWNTGAFDPDTGVYYAFSHDIPRVYRLAKRSAPTRRWTTGVPIATRRISTACRSSNRPTGGSSPSTSIAASTCGARSTAMAPGITRCSRIFIRRRSALPAGRRRSSPRHCCSSATAATSSAARTRRCRRPAAARAHAGSRPRRRRAPTAG